ncbi:hypothetical protein PMAYCL1PPCAC_03010, partial [Pristionchus mayeri]
LKPCEYEYRQAVFKRIERLGRNNLTEYNLVNDWQYFFSDLFACQFNPNSRPITNENITEREKAVVSVHLPMLLSNFLISHKIDFLCFERQFILYNINQSINL